MRDSLEKQVIRVQYGEHKNQYGELRLPEGEGPFPVIILIHGGFWRAGFSLNLMDPMAEDLTSRGVATWNIEYRGVGEGGGFPTTFQDVAKAADHLIQLAKTYPLDLEKTFVIGHSAGGHLALWLGYRSRLTESSGIKSETETPTIKLSGIVSLAGVNDLQMMQQIHQIRGQENPTEGLMGGAPREVPERYKAGSPIENLPITIPQIIVHGAMDVNVPVGISEQYVERAKEAGDPIHFIKLPFTEHFKVIDPNSSVWDTIVRSMGTVLLLPF